MQFRSRPLWEINQVGSSLPQSRFHLKETTWAMTMGFLLPRVPYEFQKGVLPLFEDPASDNIQASMPACNEYGVAGTSEIEPPPAPRARSLREGKARGNSLAHGDISPEEPGSSDDEGDGVALPRAPCGREGTAAPPAVAKNLPGGEPPEQPAPPGSPLMEESDQESEAIPPPLAEVEVREESLSLPGLFDDLANKRWSFAGSKRVRR